MISELAGADTSINRTRAQRILMELLRCSWLWTSSNRHHHHEDWPPSGEKDVSDCVWHGVAKRRHIALCFVLDRSQGRRDRPRARAGAENDKRVHLQDVASEQDAQGVRQQRRYKANDDQGDSGLLQARYEARACAQA